MKLKKIKKGMTLLELIISLAILGIIITPIFSLTINTVKMNKKSDDKLKALAIAQEYMEYIKSPEHSLEDINNAENLPAQKNGFEIVKTIEGVEKYKFTHGESDDIDIDSDIEILVNKNNEVIVNGKSLGVAGSQNNTLDIVNYKDGNSSHQQVKINLGNKQHVEIIQEIRDLIIKVELQGTLDINLNFTNQHNTNMIVYVIKDSGYSVILKGDYVEGGNISGDDDEEEDNEALENEYRLYKAKVEVWKIGEEDDKPLQTLEGYKTIFK